LSSGELARLSLALETSCLEGDGGDAGGRPVQLVVYDEIDAHIGGEAAVAVARLLRSQGRKWQVVAISHNPVIAAAADVHLVVQRTGAGAGSNKNSGSGGAACSSPSPSPSPSSVAEQKSQVFEVRGADREAELARMATGKLDTSAGRDLAKALLEAFAF